MYCTSIDDMNALVEPLPLVPAMCMVFNGLKSEGCQKIPLLAFHDQDFGMQRKASHTSYPILRHQSIISGMAFLCRLWPDFRMALTIEKLDCRVFKADTASWADGQCAAIQPARAVAPMLTA